MLVSAYVEESGPLVSAEGMVQAWVAQKILNVTF